MKNGSSIDKFGNVHLGTHFPTRDSLSEESGEEDDSDSE